MKTKRIPAILMLFAGSITSIIAYLLHYPLDSMLWALLITLVVFYAIGAVIAFLLERFEKENEERAAAEAQAQEEEVSSEGNVVEKEAIPDEEMSE